MLDMFDMLHMCAMFDMLHMSNIHPGQIIYIVSKLSGRALHLAYKLPMGKYSPRDLIGPNYLTIFRRIYGIVLANFKDINSHFPILGVILANFLSDFGL